MNGAMTTLAAPTVTAPNAMKNSLISGDQRGQDTRNESPSRAAAQRIKASCATPPSNTPQAAASAAFGNHADASKVAIIARLRKLDHAAAAQNRSMAFSIAESCA